jgi:hypothetical protein
MRRSLCCTVPHHVADTAEPGLADLAARPRGVLARAILETAGKFMMSPTHSFFFFRGSLAATRYLQYWNFFSGPVLLPISRLEIGV